MQLPDGRHVPDLRLDPSRVERCRALADAVTAPVLELVQRHTTVSIERTVLRLYGMDDADASGVPLVNRAVDALQARGLLDRGAAYWRGYVLRGGPAEPAAVVERLAALPPHPAPLAEAEERELRADLRREARARVDALLDRVRRRNALRDELGVGASPLRYVIVATGNIHDDVEQARAAAQAGADVIAVIRSTAQSLLDYVPHGATTEGYGGTYATQENFRIMREALDDESRRLRRYVHLTNYSSGLCMPEIAFAAAWERLDMLLNDAMYGILFRDINMRRTLCDQHFSRRVCALADVVIHTGEDNYITTADADEAAHTVIASQFVNESFAHRAGLPDRLVGLGHAFEIDPAREDTIARELAQALLVRTLFPGAPIKYMPPTKHKQGDIFFSHAYDVMADVVAAVTGQGIQLLGMMTEAMHNPLLMDRYVALKTSAYVARAWRSMGAELALRPGGLVERRANETLAKALALLEEVAADGLMRAIGEGRFADIARTEDGGKGLAGVVPRGPAYFNPLLEIMETR
ncbi:lysine 5,6-aminomutase subunit alpha [Anaeromyxobacter oryzisoli]|uniref:lysine 5,6-aminomutase subunit alpha n=1 Tax=Anaeromyxobacter oryzisoli TaxID=2925408 RepID=UPI001F576BA1|nr:lysine 5,6-aminomutase subunit alpha [Anaeromyxobacter sp. SG63]